MVLISRKEQCLLGVPVELLAVARVESIPTTPDPDASKNIKDKRMQMGIAAAKRLGKSGVKFVAKNSGHFRASFLRKENSKISPEISRQFPWRLQHKLLVVCSYFLFFLANKTGT